MIRAADIPVLQTERLVLRPLDAGDAQGLMAFLRSDRAAPLGGPMSAADAWETAALVLGHWALRGFGLCAVVPRGAKAAIGSVGCLWPARWPEGEIAWHLWTDDAEGRGFAQEAAQAARRHAFGVLGWTSAVSYIMPGNARSIRLAERLGASLDPVAAHPFGDAPCGVWRHPAGGAA
jgi:RimJ/RimL family protein N-acetyltransferase